jgi:hypothetical protein
MLYLRELQLCCPATVAQPTPRWCAAPPLLDSGLGIHDSMDLYPQLAKRLAALAGSRGKFRVNRLAARPTSNQCDFSNEPEGLLARVAKFCER